MSSKYLELVPNGMDPTAYELWRTNAFAAVLGARGGAAFAGAHLAFDCGMIDVEVLKDAGCPGAITAVSAMTVFLGMKFLTPITKDQVYIYTTHWVGEGRPNLYQWPAQAGQEPQAPVEIGANDPCRTIKPRELVAPPDDRHHKWESYKRGLDFAFAMLQSSMSEGFKSALRETGSYNNAVTTGDLLAVTNIIKIRAIRGNRLMSWVVTKAIDRVLDPVEAGTRQKDAESDDDYCSRFKKLVDAAHSLRINSEGGVITPLLERDCVQGLFFGLRKAFDVVKLQWQVGSQEFPDLDSAILRVKITGQNMTRNSDEATLSKRKFDHSESEQYAQRVTPGFSNTYSRRRVQFPSVPAPAPSLSGRGPAPFLFTPPSNDHSGRIMLTENEDEDNDEALYTEGQVQQLIDEATTATVFATHGHYYNMLPPPQLHWNQGPHVLQVAPTTHHTQHPCRNFVATGTCQYGTSCKFSHAQPNQVKSPSAADSTKKIAIAPARVNPFAARPN